LTANKLGYRENIINISSLYFGFFEISGRIFIG